MKRYQITLEQGLYLAAFAIALIVRLIFLGSSLLVDDEASLGLQALALVKGDRTIVEPQPGYLIPTMLLFLFSGANEFSARFFPALIGSSLVWIPCLFRSQLGRGWAVLTALFIALDPGLIAISRQANGILFGAAGVLFFLGFWVNRRIYLAGISLGIALLGGPALWQGVFSLVLAAFIFRVLNQRFFKDNDQESSSPGIFLGLPRQNGLKLIIAAATTFFILGSAFFLVPTGLGSAAAGLPVYLIGWFAPSGVPFSRMLNALTTTEFFLFLLGLITLWKSISSDNAFEKFVGLWWVVVTLLVMVYPSREVRDLIWSLIPLACLAARQIPGLTQVRPVDRSVVFGQFLLTSILLVFSWFNLLGVVRSQEVSLATLASLFSFDSTGAVSANAEDVLKLIALLGGIILLILTTLLIAWGWRPGVAWKGLSQAISLIFLILTLSATGRSAGLTKLPQAEWWNSSPFFLEGKWLVQTIQDFSKWNRSEANVLDISIIGSDLPSLRWALRGMQNAVWTIGIATGSKPSLVITPENIELNLASNYRGQDFVYSSSPMFPLLSPIDWPRWLAFREGLIENKALILWVRSDLFPGSAVQGTDYVP